MFKFDRNTIPTILTFCVFLMALLLIFSIIYGLAEPHWRSEETQIQINQDNAERYVQAEIRREQESIESARRVMKSFVYIQDPRTNFCFAIRNVYRQGYMATVPCDEIPAGMLQTMNNP